MTQNYKQSKLEVYLMGSLGLVTNCFVLFLDSVKGEFLFAVVDGLLVGCVEILG